MARKLSGSKVLITEVQDECRTILAMLLKDWGCTVIEARDGLDAIEKAVSTRPDLILMDLRMPKLGGLEATRRLKNNPSTADIPVVICTPLGTQALGYAKLSDEPLELLKKPIRLERLREVVQKYLLLRQESLFMAETQQGRDVLAAWRLLRKIKLDLCLDSPGCGLAETHNYSDEREPAGTSGGEEKNREVLPRLLSVIKGGKLCAGFVQLIVGSSGCLNLLSFALR